MLVQLRFKALKEGKGIGRAAGKTGEDPALMDTPNLARAGLDDDVVKGDLPITAHGDTLAAANGQNRRTVVLVHTQLLLVVLIPGEHDLGNGLQPDDAEQLGKQVVGMTEYNLSPLPLHRGEKVEQGTRTEEVHPRYR